MTLKEFYLEADGDYEEVMSGLGKEERIVRYLRKFPETKMPVKIKDALENKDYETAFRESHNLKGMCLNISLIKLGVVSSDLTESLRNGPKGDVEGLFKMVDKEYERVSNLILQID